MIFKIIIALVIWDVIKGIFSIQTEKWLKNNQHKKDRKSFDEKIKDKMNEKN